MYLTTNTTAKYQYMYMIDHFKFTVCSYRNYIVQIVHDTRTATSGIINCHRGTGSFLLYRHTYRYWEYNQIQIYFLMSICQCQLSPVTIITSRNTTVRMLRHVTNMILYYNISQLYQKGIWNHKNCVLSWRRTNIGYINDIFLKIKKNILRLML